MLLRQIVAMRVLRTDDDTSPFTHANDTHAEYMKSLPALRERAIAKTGLQLYTNMARVVASSMLHVDDR
jgi:hypothetical protein